MKYYNEILQRMIRFY